MKRSETTPTDLAASSASGDRLINDLLKSGFERHRSGDLEAAAGHCRAVLEREPAQAHALHLLGVIAHQQGRNDEAAQWFAQALASDAGNPHLHNSLGEVRRVLGDTAGAIACYHEAIRMDQRYAQPHANLGMVLAHQGQLDAAIDAFEAAVRIEPERAQWRNSLGVAQQWAHRTDAAIAAFRAAVQLDPQHAEAHYNLGAGLYVAGEVEPALVSLREAVRLEPRLSRAWWSLSNVLVDLGRAVEAEKPARRAVALAPDEPEFRYNLARILRRIAKASEAATELHAVLAADPEHPRAHHDLGVDRLLGGELDAAITHFRRALAADPGLYVAYTNLAQARRFSSADAAEIGSIQALLEQPDLSDHGRTHLHFALGKIQDDRGQEDQAMEHFHAANALHRREVDFDPQTLSRFVDDTIALYTPEFLGSHPGFANASERPIFIVGMPRSGMALVAQILAAHPRLEGGGELDFYRVIERDLPGWIGSAQPYPQCVEAMSDGIAQAIATAYLERLDRAVGDAPERSERPRITDHAPSTVHHLGLVSMLFPNARFIHCVRDPMDIGLSIYGRFFPAEHAYAYDLADIGGYYRHYRRLIAHWQAVLPGRIHDLRYEALIADQEGVTRALLEWLELPWDAACLRFFRARCPVGAASAWSVRQPLYAHSVGRWRRYAAHLDRLRDALETRAAPDRAPDQAK